MHSRVLSHSKRIMSNLEHQELNDSACSDMRKGAIRLVVEPRSKDLGGFSVRRLLPAAKVRSVGPFIFFDHMGPARFEVGQGIDVRPHPHIGLATITYLFEGEIMHRDSLGYVQPIRPGEINLMVAGRGIVHSERTGDAMRAAGHSLNGLQMWIALPEADQETEPEFLNYTQAELPVIEMPGCQVRLMMGQAYGEVSPVKCFSPILYLEARMDAGSCLKLPETSELALYMVKGGIQCGEHALNQGVVAILNRGKMSYLQASEDCTLALFGGDSLGPRYLDWNLVSTSQARLQQAREDWKAGRFPKVPGDNEFIPLPE